MQVVGKRIEDNEIKLHLKITGLRDRLTKFFPICPIVTKSKYIYKLLCVATRAAGPLKSVKFANWQTKEWKRTKLGRRRSFDDADTLRSSIIQACESY